MHGKIMGQALLRWVHLVLLFVVSVLLQLPPVYIFVASHKRQKACSSEEPTQGSCLATKRSRLHENLPSCYYSHVAHAIYFKLLIKLSTPSSCRINHLLMKKSKGTPPPICGLWSRTPPY